MLTGDCFKKFFHDKKIERCLGLDIGTGNIKIVEVFFKRERPVLENFVIEPIPNGLIDNGIIKDEAQMFSLLQKIFTVNHFKSKYIVVSVATRNIVLREVITPQMSFEEAKNAIFWELDKYVPDMPDTYYFDVAVLGQAKEDGMQRNLLVAAPRETIDKVADILRLLGFLTVSFSVEPVAYSRILNDKEVILIDIGEQFTNISIYFEGVPLINRPIAIGGRSFTEMVAHVMDMDLEAAEQIKKKKKIISEMLFSDGDRGEMLKQMEMLVEDLARETHRTLEYYQMQSVEVAIGKAVIIGGGAQMILLPDLITDRLQMPVCLHNSLMNVDVLLAFERQYVQEIAPQLSVAIGLALIGGEKND